MDNVDEELKKIYQCVDQIMNQVSTYCGGNTLRVSAVLSIAAGEAAALSGVRLSSVLGIITEAHERIVQGIANVSSVISNNPEIIENAVKKTLETNPSFDKEKLKEVLKCDEATGIEIDAMFQKFAKKPVSN